MTVSVALDLKQTKMRKSRRCQALGLLGPLLGAALVLGGCRVEAPQQGDPRAHLVRGRGTAPVISPWRTPQATSIFAGTWHMRSPLRRSRSDLRYLQGEVLLQNAEELRPAGECVVRAWLAGRRVDDGTTSCEPDGHFELGLQRVSGTDGRAIRIEILVPSHLRAELAMPDGEASRLPTVALGSAVQVRGRVHADQGPLPPGLRVELRPWPGLGEHEPWRTGVAEDGRFEADHLPYGPLRLHLLAGKELLQVVDTIAPSSQLHLQLPPTVEHHGRVEWSAPVVAKVPDLSTAQMWLELIYPSSQARRLVDLGSARSRLRIGADTSFSFRAIDGREAWARIIVASEASLSDRAEGVPQLASNWRFVRSPSHRLAFLISDKTDESLSIRDEDGRILVGACLQLAAGTGGAASGRCLCRSDAAGDCRHATVLPTEMPLRLTRRGYLTEQLSGSLLRSSGELRMRKSSVLRWRIEGSNPGQRNPGEFQLERWLSASEQPIVQGRTELFYVAPGDLNNAGSLGHLSGPLAHVSSRAGDAWVPLYVGAAEVRQRQFELRGLKPGRYRLRLRPNQRSGSRWHIFNLDGEHRVTIEVERSWHLRGRIRADPELLGQVEVMVSDELGLKPTEDGAFDFGWQVGPAMVTVLRSGSSEAGEENVSGDGSVTSTILARRNVEPGSAGIDLKLRSRVVVLGQIFDEHHEVVEDAQIVVHDAGQQASSAAHSDSQGQFRLDIPRPTPGCAVIVSADGFLNHQRSCPDVGASGPSGTQLGTIELQPIILEQAWEATFELVEARSGRQLQDVVLRAAGLAPLRTDEDGLVSFSDLPHNEIEFMIEAEGMIPRNIAIDRRSIERLRGPMRIELEPGGSISGIVIDERGEPVIGARIELASANGARFDEAVSDNHGQWRIVGVREGEVRYRIYPPADRSEELLDSEGASDVRAGLETRDMDVRLEWRR